MATNTTGLKTFAQETRKKLISLISTKMDFILTQDTAELRGFESQIAKFKSTVASQGKDLVVEEVAYTWFNRVMALRYMDANGYTDLKVVTPGIGQMRPEILQEAMAGNINEDLRVKVDDNPKEAVLYRRLLVAVCNRYGASMPFLFEHICDYTEMLLPDDLLSDQSFVTDIRNGMTDEDCRNVEIMGWLYQFYITDRKDDAEKKKSKKGGLKSDEQAAATQLFTPHWIVRYMVENSLGRIWMTLHPDSRLIDEMPYYISAPFGQSDTVPDDIRSARDIRFIDPCMGSGHILVCAFDLFCRMYEEEGYQTREIPALILQNNLYGLDIDRRCYQLASFALTMKGRAYHSRYLRKVVNPNVISLQNIDRGTIASAGNWDDKSLMWQFEHIDTIGSLLKVTPEEYAAIHVEEGIFGYKQQILKIQAEYLSRKYHCVVTNPPYLGKGIGDELKQYMAIEYPNSKADMMTAFMERCEYFCPVDGKYSMINMQSWMFVSTYESLRRTILETQQINSVLHLGPHTFDEISGEVVQNVAFVFTNSNNSNSLGVFIRLFEGRDSSEKEHLYINNLSVKTKGIYYPNVKQSDLLSIPGCPLGYWASNNILKTFNNNSIENISISDGQNITANNDKYLKFFWEVDHRDIVSCRKWRLYAKGGEYRKWYGNLETVIDWSDEARDFYHRNSSARIIPKYLWYREGISWTLLSSRTTGFRYLPEKATFDKTGSSIFIKEEYSLKKCLALLNSKVSMELLKIYSSTIAFQIGEIRRIPYIDTNYEVETLVSDNISISKLDWDSHETSWDFLRNPLWDQQLILPDLPQPLEILVDNYMSDWERRFHILHRNEEELNRRFIEIYGLQDELTPDVPLDEITILQKGEISIEDNHIVWHDDVIIKQFISWMTGCFMGRYSADKPGLIIASQGQKVTDLDLPAMTLQIDDDGIIPVIQEADFFTDDLTHRIEAGIKALFGETNFYDNLKYIKACLGQELRDYLYKDFYDDHMQMYSVKGAKRPIYWLFSSKMGDKKKKGWFKALVYMHRIESDTLSKLHADYVLPYLDKIEQQKQEAEDDAIRDDLTQAQRNKANKLALELADKVREVKEFATILAQMSTRRLTIDLDDGVRVNYPKYYPLVEPIKGLDAIEE